MATEVHRTATAAPPQPERPGLARPSGRRRRRAGRLLTITLFLLPALVLFLGLVITPVVFGIYTSFFKWNGFVTTPMKFIGLDNFSRLLDDDIFKGDLKRGAILVGLSLAIQLPVSLGLALLLNQQIRFRSVYRLIFFAPYVLSEVIAAVLFTMVLSPETGLVNQILTKVGLDSLAEEWLGNTSLVLYTLFFVVSWKYFGFHMILYLAGRQNIPKELTEAAMTDGAGAWQVFRRITLPLLGPTIRISVFLSVIGAIQLFDMVYVLTGGGPVNASETMAVTMFQFGFRRNEIGYASAISVAMFLISLIFAMFYQRFVLRRDIEGAITTMGGKR
jgi:raffinose/stachyose/melibiose transport system permease protein